MGLLQNFSFSFLVASLYTFAAVHSNPDNLPAASAASKIRPKRRKKKHVVAKMFDIKTRRKPSEKMHNYIVFRSLFEGCTSLRDLSLAANFLRQWPALELQPVSHHLHTLDMGENSLRSLEPLTEFKKLYGLRLAGNRLRNITADSFGHKSHLKMLNVADNLLEFIDIAAFESLKHLRVCKHNKCILPISV